MTEKKKLLLLGGSAQQVVAIDTAKRLGYETVLCDYLPDNPGQYHADRFYLTSTTDKEAVLAVARQEGVQGVLAYASDPAAPSAAYVAQELGLPGNPCRSVEILCNKDLFRAFLAEHGFCTPRAKGYTDPAQALADLRAGYFRLPVIVKPVDSSGSKGATVLRGTDRAPEALEFALSFSRGHRLVVEEYIEKKHKYLVGGDIFVVDGAVELWGLLNCHRDAKVNPLVPVGKSYPLALGDDEAASIRGTLQRLVTALGIRQGAMNVELVMDAENRVWPIDIGPRNGGNMIPDLLGMIFDVDIVELSVQAAMGVSRHVRAGEGKGFYATHNLHSDRPGVFEGVGFSPELEGHIVRSCIYKRPGDPVEYFDNASKALGILFLRFDSAGEMEQILTDIDRHIQIRLS